jgi:hypothetical protein
MPAPLDSLKSTWKNCIANNAFGQLFREMNAQLNKSSSNYNIFISIQAQYSDIYIKDMQNAVSYTDAQVAYGKTKNSLLQLIDLLNPDDIAPNSAACEDVLDTLARNLKPRSGLMPLLYLVNCDRIKAKEIFDNRFESLKQQARTFQFYFILACPTQEPDSFSERTIYEIMGEDEDQNQAVLKYPRHENNRVQIESLPTSKEEFKKYFSKSFTLGNTSFEDYLRTELPNLNWEKIAIPLSITALEWNAKVVDSLQWLINSFSAVETRSPNFLFFFVITLKNAHETDKIHPKYKETLQSIKQLVEKNADCATLIDTLPPVETEDFEGWLEKLAKPPQAKKNEIIKTIVEQRLTDEEKAQFEDSSKGNPLNMEHIEDFQARVYKFHK